MDPGNKGKDETASRMRSNKRKLEGEFGKGEWKRRMKGRCNEKETRYEMTKTKLGRVIEREKKKLKQTGKRRERNKKRTEKGGLMR